MKQSINCNVSVSSLKYWKGNSVALRPNTIYNLTIDYPFNKSSNYPIKTGADGMGLSGLLIKIGKFYDKKYESVETDDEDGYWHSIDDLVIEGITVDHSKKTIKLDVGS